MSVQEELELGKEVPTKSSKVFFLPMMIPVYDGERQTRMERRKG